MSKDTKIEKRVKIEDYLRVIKKYAKEEIECTEHTFFRLSQKQRGVFTCK